MELLKYAVLHNPKIRDVDMEDQVAVNEDSTTAIITFDVSKTKPYLIGSCLRLPSKVIELLNLRPR